MIGVAFWAPGSFVMYDGVLSVIVEMELPCDAPYNQRCIVLSTLVGSRTGLKFHSSRGT